MEPGLSPLQRKALKVRAHALHPVVLIGDKGLSQAVLREIEVSLKSHELIKIHVANGDRAERDEMLETICERLQAQPVQHIGRMLVVYRERPPESPIRRKAPPQRLRARTAARASATRHRPQTRALKDHPSAGAPPRRARPARAPATQAARRRAGPRAAPPARPGRSPVSSARAPAATPARRRARTR
jgi:RNA-binding protein